MEVQGVSSMPWRFHVNQRGPTYACIGLGLATGCSCRFTCWLSLPPSNLPTCSQLTFSPVPGTCQPCSHCPYFPE